MNTCLSFIFLTLFLPLSLPAGEIFPHPEEVDNNYFLQDIRRRVDPKIWASIPFIEFDKDRFPFEGEYPIVEKKDLGEHQALLYRLPSGRIGLAIRYQIWFYDEANNLSLWGTQVEAVFQRYTYDKSNFAPVSGGPFGWYLGTSGGCGEFTTEKFAALLSGHPVALDRKVFTIDRESSLNTLYKFMFALGSCNLL